MTDLAHFEITVGAAGRGRVVVNGEDVSDKVKGVAVVAEVGQVTVLTLRMAPSAGVISGEGIVRVDTEGDDTVAFLESIDPKELERIVLDQAADFGAQNPLAEALDQLKRWARGG